MLKSMTGYGRGEAVIGTQNATVEVRSVNHRYLDFQLRVPRCLLPLESKIKKLISSFVSRGKVEISVQLGADVNGENSLSVNTDMAEHAAATKPTATPDLREGVMLLYMALWNQPIVDTSCGPDYLQFSNDAGTVISKKTLPRQWVHIH